MYSPSVELRRFVKEEHWSYLIIQDQSKYLVDVYLNDDDKKFENRFCNTYIIKLAKEMSTDPPCDLLVLFPNHPESSKRVLDTRAYSKYNTLSNEINKRCDESYKGEAVKMAIVCGKHLFRIRGIFGTVYLFWAERVNQQSLHQQRNNIAEHVPVLFELNGKMDIRNIVILPASNDSQFLNDAYGHKSMYPLRRNTVTLQTPTDRVLFCCEADTRVEQHRQIKTISSDIADTITKDPVVRTVSLSVQEEEIPFAEHTIMSEIGDPDETSLVVDSTNASSDFEEIRLQPMTPRIQLNDKQKEIPVEMLHDN
jgi:hypothetical protein